MKDWITRSRSPNVSSAGCPTRAAASANSPSEARETALSSRARRWASTGTIGLSSAICSLSSRRAGGGNSSRPASLLIPEPVFGFLQIAEIGRRQGHVQNLAHGQFHGHLRDDLLRHH